jgi:hypothetical protein
VPDYRKLDLEKLRADLAKAAHERPPLVTGARSLLESLKPELLEMLRVGYTARDITEKINQHGVPLKLATIQWHLRQMRAATKKPRRRSPAAKAEAVAQPADKPAPASSEFKPKTTDLFDKAEDEVAF